MSKGIQWGTVAVLGAAGKMGRGISLLLLQELAKQEKFSLILIDSNPEALVDLKKYLHTQLLKYAERSINSLREHFRLRNELVDNSDMIETFT
jgi:3-hydroxyacyl-CoA dehydrogenase